MRPRGVRTRLFLAVMVAVGLALALMLLAFNLVLGRSLSHEADQVARSRATAELAVVRAGPGGLALGEGPDAAAPDTPVWVYAGTRRLEGPRAGVALTAASRALVGAPGGYVTVADPHMRLYAEPIVENGRRLGTIVGGVSLAPYDQTRRTALLGSIGLGVLLLVVVALAARWLLASALRPVARMTGLAAAWSETDIDHRFGGGPPHDELTQLAATLDGLLDRLAASLRREQRFSAELSHELRLPLSRVLAETELALRREREPEEYRQALADVHRDAQQLARTVEALVAAARQESGAARGTADAYAIATEAVEACAGLAAQRDVDLAAEPPTAPLRIGIDGQLAERILQPVVENACRYGKHNVRVTVSRDTTRVLYVVEDDGPGIPQAERELIFEPGVRGTSGATTDGAGLGLALARRLARSASGDIDVEASAAGARFVIALPTA